MYSAALIVALAGVYFLFFGRGNSAAVQYEFATISRGDIQSTISATGTLAPVASVEVGTQVSGTVDTVYVDFNDKVKENQLIAILDTSLLKATVQDAEAAMERAEAQLEGAQADYDRNKALLERNLISKETFQPFEINLKSQRAALQSADAAVERARRNLEYAVIRSPISGIVISRSVEPGQTVAASLSAPVLFIIAKDLSKMEILAAVDESDIGQISVGQAVSFEVAAHSGKEFKGTVQQVRLQPTTVSNVVTYTVVVEAENENDLLLPGMTATLDFIIDQRTDVLTVPNKALRFKPSDDEVAAARARMPQRPQGERAERENGERAERPREGGDSARGGGMRMGGPPSDSARARWRNNANMVWYLDSLGQLAFAPFQPGLSDGTNTEIAMSRTLKEGMQIIAGIKDNSVATTNRSASPLSGQQPGGGMRRGF